jgi:hypothetical protein
LKAVPAAGNRARDPDPTSLETVTRNPLGVPFLATVCHPDRYMDERGQKMWDTVQELLEEQAGMRVDPHVHEVAASCS